MKIANFLILLSLLITPSISANNFKPEQQKQADECDFSELKYLRISDYKVPVKKKTEAEYPPMAIEAKVTGIVQVKVLVDQGGNVIRACATEGHPMLKEAAMAAARKWKFVRYFGMRTGRKIKYMQEWILFNFMLDDAKKPSNRATQPSILPRATILATTSKPARSVSSVASTKA